MAKKSLYFNTTTKTELTSLPDAVNRELQKNDFVTAVFGNGELTLFKIVGFEKHKIEYFMDYSQLSDESAKKIGPNAKDKGIVLTRFEDNYYVVLQRVRGTNAYTEGKTVEDKKFNAQLVYKTSKQVAYADPNFVTLHYLAN